MAGRLLQWEAAHPFRRPPLRDPDPPIDQTARELDGLMKLDPATLAQECVSLFMFDVRTLAIGLQARGPTYACWLEHADMAPA
jgi:hypothetical protein